MSEEAFRLFVSMSLLSGLVTWIRLSTKSNTIGFIFTVLMIALITMLSMAIYYSL